MKIRPYKNISIKWKLFMYLSIFVIFIIIILWFFQIIFLDSFYKSIKIREIKNISEQISKNINTDNFGNIIEKLSYDSSICVIIATKKGAIKLSIESYPYCIIHKMSANQFNTIVSNIEMNDGLYFNVIPEDYLRGNTKNNFLFGDSMTAYQKEVEESIILAKTINMNGQENILILNTNIKPVDATISTIKAQLYILTIILIIFAFILAFYISKKISIPIIKINHASKKLAKGNYNVNFNQSEYKEIAELGNTLNYTANELNKVENLRRELIANISHDLRTPLTMITGYSELIRDFPSENKPENIQVIIDESNRLTTLVNDILDLSKLQSGNIKVNFSNINLTNIIKQIIYRFAKLTEQNKYKIDFIYDREVTVFSDEIRISQVIYNLVNNAITYTGSDNLVTVKQTIIGNDVVIQITDTGEGISQEKIKDIWDRYYKIENKHRRSHIGTGLGLSIVKEILELHNAKYGVKSTLGQGSCFWFSLKIKK